MKQVAIYCRLSEEDKGKSEKEDSESIQNQKKILTGYALEKGWEIFKVYADDDWSGLDQDRPAWKELINDAKGRKFDIVLCKSQARFTREMETVEKYLHKLFPLWNIRFVGLADAADTDNLGNKKQRQINGLVNEWYCEDLSENIKLVFDKKRKDGVFIGSHASYGYQKDPRNKGKLMIDEEAARVVRLIFDLFLDGMGSGKITRYLNDKEIPNPSRYKELHSGGKPRNNEIEDCEGLWNRTTVKRILKNEMYLGNMVQGIRKKPSYKSKEVVSVPKNQWIIVNNTHEPIIEEETFSQVQRLLKEKKRSDGHGNCHVLSGKVKCMVCGSTMYRVTLQNRNGNIRYHYLRCSRANKKTGLCNGPTIRLDLLESLVQNKMRLYLQTVNEKIIEDELKKYKLDKISTNQSREVKVLDRKIKENNRMIEALYRDNTSGAFSPAQFDELVSPLLKNNERLRNKKENLMKSAVNEPDSLNDTDFTKKFIHQYKEMKGLTARYVNEFIDSIEIGEKDRDNLTQKIRINWKY